MPLLLLMSNDDEDEDGDHDDDDKITMIAANMVESPTQLPQAFSADAPPPPGSPSTPGSPEQLDLHHPSPSCGKNAIERPAWVKIIDRNTQRPYYWNRITEEVQWDAPIVEENVSERDRRIAAKTRYCKSERAKQVFLFV
jgi:hypothetical protein